MSEISQAVLSGSAFALQQVRQFLANPSITFETSTVTFEVTDFRESVTAAVSKLLLVDISNGKEFVNDNIVPNPRSWRLTGYIFPQVSFGSKGAVDVGFTPEVSQIFLEQSKTVLRNAVKSRKLVDFKPVATDLASQFVNTFAGAFGSNYTGTIKVAIEDVEFSFDPSVTNKAPFSLTVLEVNNITASFANLGTDTAYPPQPNDYGNSSNQVVQ